MKLATYTILPLLTFAPFLVSADVPPVDRIGVPAVLVCKLGPQGNPIRARKCRSRWATERPDE